MRRRHLLAALASASLAGCSADLDDYLPATPTETGTPTATETPTETETETAAETDTPTTSETPTETETETATETETLGPEARAAQEDIDELQAELADTLEEYTRQGAGPALTDVDATDHPFQPGAIVTGANTILNGSNRIEPQTPAQEAAVAALRAIARALQPMAYTQRDLGRAYNTYRSAVQRLVADEYVQADDNREDGWTRYEEASGWHERLAGQYTEADFEGLEPIEPSAVLAKIAQLGDELAAIESLDGFITDVIDAADRLASGRRAFDRRDYDEAELFAEAAARDFGDIITAIDEAAFTPAFAPLAEDIRERATTKQAEAEDLEARAAERT